MTMTRPLESEGHLRHRRRDRRSDRAVTPSAVHPERAVPVNPVRGLVGLVVALVADHRMELVMKPVMGARPVALQEIVAPVIVRQVVRVTQGRAVATPGIARVSAVTRAAVGTTTATVAVGTEMVAAAVIVGAVTVAVAAEIVAVGAETVADHRVEPVVHPNQCGCVCLFWLLPRL